MDTERELTVLEKYVKKSILTHVLLYPSRLEVLYELFFQSDYVTFQNNEFFVNDDNFDLIKIEDFVKKIPKKMRINPSYKEEKSLQFRKYLNEFKFIEKNIDDIVRSRINYVTNRYTIHSIANRFIKHPHSIAEQIINSDDLSLIDRVWREGIIEIASWYVDQTNRFYDLNVIAPDSKNKADYITDPKIKKVYLYMDQLTPKLRTKAEKAQVASTVAKILERLKSL